MTTALMLLLIQGVLGTWDTIWYHEVQQAIPSRATGKRELFLHAVRDFIYAILFISLAWRAWHGLYAWALVAFLAFEIAITLWDFIEEDIHRPLPAGERVMHTIMAIVYGAFLSNLLPQIWNWSQLTTSFPSADYGWISLAMTLFAAGVFLSGVRDLWASLEWSSSGPISHNSSY